MASPAGALAGTARSSCIGPDLYSWTVCSRRCNPRFSSLELRIGCGIALASCGDWECVLAQVLPVVRVAHELHWVAMTKLPQSTQPGARFVHR